MWTCQSPSVQLFAKDRKQPPMPRALWTLVIALAPALLLAQQATPPAAVTPERIAAMEAAIQSAQSAGDNAWMLVCAALVLMMTGPGLALFYGGLVGHKNVVAIMMQSFGLMGLVTVLWGLVGYIVCFCGRVHWDGTFLVGFLGGVA